MEQEREILDRLAQGDREAFDALYLHYAPKVEELAFWMLKNRTEAEDVMQSIMLKVWERKEEIAQMTRFSKLPLYDDEKRYFRHLQPFAGA